MTLNSSESVPASATLLAARPPSASVLGLRTATLSHRVGLAGKCSDAADDRWYPDFSRLRSYQRQAAYARAACLGCPVIEECLELALRIESQVPGKPHGVWGGTAPYERRSMIGARRGAVSS